jgi:hypothetical protein
MAEDSRPTADPTILTTEALQREIDHLSKLTDEKFRGRDVALVAALAAADRAVGKTETMFAKQIEGQDDKVDDLRDRVKAMEGRSQGVGLSSGVVVQAITIAIAGAAVLIAFLHRS